MKGKIIFTTFLRRPLSLRGAGIKRENFSGFPNVHTIILREKVNLTRVTLMNSTVSESLNFVSFRITYHVISNPELDPAPGPQLFRSGCDPL